MKSNNAAEQLSTEDPQRRNFLKLGLLSTGLLAGAGVVSGLTGCSETAAPQRRGYTRITCPHRIGGFITRRTSSANCSASTVNGKD